MAQPHREERESIPSIFKIQQFDWTSLVEYIWRTKRNANSNNNNNKLLNHDLVGEVGIANSKIVACVLWFRANESLGRWCW